MSEDGEPGFLGRWSRRKLASRERPPETAPDETPPADGVPEDAPPDLPSLGSLGPDTDYTVFLARGVSRAVQAQALRVAWASDPAIAAFRGFAEYAWDFNAPGYGDLAPGDNAATWMADFVRSQAAGWISAAPEALPAPAPVPAETPPTLTEAGAPETAEQPPAITRQATVAEPVMPAGVSRRHGGALPV